MALLTAGLLGAALAACGDDTGGTGGGGGEGTTATTGTTTGTTTSGPTTSGSTSSGMGTGGMGTGGEGTGGTGGGGVGTIYEVASSLPDYSSLVAAVDKAGLAEALDDPDATFTVFAPDNDAFAALLEGIGASSLDDVTAEQLVPILLYHVLGAEVDSSAALEAATAGERVDALGGSIRLGLEGEQIELDDTAIVEVADVPASNGIIHGIDAVILPSVVDVATTTPGFESLVAALGLADTDPSEPGLVAALDDDEATFTVFAPTDDAFTDLLTVLALSNTGIEELGDFAPYQVLPVLKYHVVAGAAVTSGMVEAGPVTTLGGIADLEVDPGVSIDGASVILADLYTSNGVIHVIDGVILPSITDVVTTEPKLSSLLGAVALADGDAGTSPKVGEALDGGGTFTLFAPSNDAFTALGKPPTGQTLTNVLLYHGLDLTVFAADALALQNPIEVDTLLGGGAGETLTVSAEGGQVVLDDAGSDTDAIVIEPNYFTSNGVIHIADKVLLPAL